MYLLFWYVYRYYMIVIKDIDFTMYIITDSVDCLTLKYLCKYWSDSEGVVEGVLREFWVHSSPKEVHIDFPQFSRWPWVTREVQIPSPGEIWHKSDKIKLHRTTLKFFILKPMVKNL